MATPKKDAKSEKEGYCKTEELARRFGVTAQWIGQLSRDGVIQKKRFNVGIRYNIEESTRSYCEYLREKAAGREEKQSKADQEEEKLKADVRIKNAKANIAEMEAKEMAGQMHCSEDVEAMTTDLVYNIRGMLIALPGRLAVDVVNMQSSAEAADYIKQEINNLLSELENYKYDPAKYAQKVRERMKWTDAGEYEA